MNTAPDNEQQGGITEAYLMDYLEGNLSMEAQHRLEVMMDRDPFLRDAVDGLSGMKDKSRITAIALQLNAQLKQQTGRRKRNRRMSLTHPRLLAWVAVLMIILFIFLAWWFFRIAFPG